MSASTSWDRAGSLPVPTSGRRSPEIAALRDTHPSVDELFTFMRDAELRFDTLRMRIDDRRWTARGEDVAQITVALRHPGAAKVLTAFPGEGSAGGYEAWVSDGATVRTYVSSRKVGTQRPARRIVRGVVDAEDLPGRSRLYAPVTPLQAESLPELFVHPGGYCQNVLGTGACAVTGTTLVAGREAIVLECDHPRTIGRTGDRPDFRIRIAVDRAEGVILRLEESIGGQLTRDAIVTSFEPDAPLTPAALSFTFPSDTTFIY
jgi:hypothetical protein